jgi:hypothetical protein
MSLEMFHDDKTTTTTTTTTTGTIFSNQNHHRSTTVSSSLQDDDANVAISPSSSSSSSSPSSSALSSSILHPCLRYAILSLLLVLFLFVIYDSAASPPQHGHYMEHLAQELFDWVSRHPFWGVVVVILVYTLGTLLFVPGSILTIGTGFAFSRAFQENNDGHNGGVVKAVAFASTVREKTTAMLRIISSFSL